ncbi:MAG: hypothetical protein J7449_08600 [Thermomicrobium sp.]|uniref:hypothetical protein n=1 Tax=Thermomicrobium sp. TaxID=1969469 RepID=UPI001B25531D|nr:hypothetical protein [Thermomicrobium sp.]MBO9351526.1 hypothetical protein [Thermomicrobium sp.]
MSRGFASLVTIAVLFGAALAATVVPTTCTCGAAAPHPHTLFELPGHYHGSPAEHASTSDLPDGPVVTAPAMPFALGTLVPVVATAILTLQLGTRRSPLFVTGTIPPGVDHRPPIPPPR